MKKLNGHDVYYYSDFMKEDNEGLLEDFLKNSDEMTRVRVLVHKKRGAYKGESGKWSIYLVLTEYPATMESLGAGQSI